MKALLVLTLSNPFSGICTDTNNGALDPFGDDCSWYDSNPGGCGYYNDADFNSNQMCCACGGGSTAGSPPVASGVANTYLHSIGPCPTECSTKNDGNSCNDGGTISKGSCLNDLCVGNVVDTTDFESGFHQWWSPTVNGDKPFILSTGSTPSFGTGPWSGAAGSSGYVYAETSGNYFQTFDMEKTYPTGQSIYGIKFQYHMFGLTVGTAVLETSDDDIRWKSLWSKSGNNGAQWLNALVYAGDHGGTHRMIRFKYTSGADDFGDFALDDIQIGD